MRLRFWRAVHDTAKTFAAWVWRARIAPILAADGATFVDETAYYKIGEAEPSEEAKASGVTKHVLYATRRDVPVSSPFRPV